jgi:prepilin-type N-terminal cleavage/methylation domain-containing protein
MSLHPDKFNKGPASPAGGFTLVEVLVALALLTVALVPAFIQATNATLLSATIRSSLVSADLAQEGVEVVRAMRDANWFAGQPFDTGLDACVDGCRVQWDSTAPLPLSGNAPLKLDAASGMYQYDTGTDSQFSRTITVTPVSAVELNVSSVVTWRERGADKTFTVEDHLFNWLAQ